LSLNLFIGDYDRSITSNQLKIIFIEGQWDLPYGLSHLKINTLGVIKTAMKMVDTKVYSTVWSTYSWMDMPTKHNAYTSISNLLQEGGEIRK